MTNVNRIIWLCPGIEYNEPKTGGMYFNYIFLNSLKCRFTRSRVKAVNLLSKKAGYSWLKERIYLNFAYLMFLFREDLRDGDLVVVDSGANSQVLLPILITRLIWRRPVLMTVFHLSFPLTVRRGLGKWVQAFCEKACIRLATHVVTISQSTKAAVSAVLGERRSSQVDVEIFHPGLNKPDPEIVIARGRRQSEKLQMITVGSCNDPRKGLDILLMALGGMAGDDFHLTLVGGYNSDDPYYCYLQKLIERFGLVEKVEFLGRVSDGRLAKLLQQKDLFVFPSLWEGYGIALGEAMSYGLPIVATDTGAIPELVTHGVNGILVPPRDPQALRQAIQSFLADSSFGSLFSQNNLMAARRFKKWPKVGVDLADHVEAILRSRVM